MSRKQWQALDEVLRKAPQPFGPVPVEKLREGFAAFMGSFPVPAGVRSAPAELAGRLAQAGNALRLTAEEAGRLGEHVYDPLLGARLARLR